MADIVDEPSTRKEKNAATTANAAPAAAEVKLDALCGKDAGKVLASGGYSQAHGGRIGARG